MIGVGGRGGPIILKGEKAGGSYNCIGRIGLFLLLEQKIY